MSEALSIAAVDPTEYAPGDLIENRYRLERLLGEGAQGTVWLANNLGLDARVAIKLVHAEKASELPTLRLEKEARAAARLGHPAVVRVFDFGRTVSGDAFIVMEYLEGQSLGEKLFECGRLPPEETLQILLPIADALAAAHARGIVHRDLKPENIFLTPDGESIQPKLLDFGIAKLAAGSERRGAITQIGALVGSPAYVSPEQAACRDDVGEHADVWSFCVVLYECLTGKVPFDSEEYPELFRQIGEDAPESILDHGVGDAALWEIVRRGLAKAPDERWPTMQSLGQALAGWLRARGVHEDVSGVLLESKWLAKSRSDPAAAMASVEPSSFVRRIERNPALRTTARAPRRPRLARYGRHAVVGGALLGAVLGAVFGLIELGSSSVPAPSGAATKKAVPARSEPKAPVVFVKGPAEAATAHETQSVAQTKALPSATTVRAAEPPRDRSPDRLDTPEAASSSDPPSQERAGEIRDDLLNPY
jgi:eukaryotic-like serine/threonine-protein kinase